MPKIEMSESQIKKLIDSKFTDIQRIATGAQPGSTINLFQSDAKKIREELDLLDQLLSILEKIYNNKEMHDL